ncbi:glycosyltransferase family 9 protein [Paraferrimonas sp. SM1919]|uniref:glycosyltransferase family 9 protein n=1 Tax=Paraferrimonas sp. SM1919 TaxID=2662263 RepID=UPI0013D3B664|nr:hypothetical protein [Paraferrimonas sp. SM1919]
MSEPKRFLFVPVSSKEGIGEYMRSLIIADAIKQQWPDAQIQFVLSQQAPYASTCPYPSLITEKSPTKHVKEVNQIVDAFKPDAVFFDASGRKAQLKHAYLSGAKVIFLSQHKRKRARGMKISRARYTHLHWVVQPDFVIGDIHPLQRLKLKLFGLKEPTNIGAVFAQPQPQQTQKLQQKHGLESGKYLIFNAGSGGHLAPDGSLAADVFYQAAKQTTAQTKHKCVMVFGANYPNELPQNDEIICISSLDNQSFINLLSDSAGAVLSGGDTFLQSVALGVPTLGVKVAKDQGPRVEAVCHRRLSRASLCNAVEIAKQTGNMLAQSDSNVRKSQNGLDFAMADLVTLLANKQHK